jgi:hypothetical protein
MSDPKAKPGTPKPVHYYLSGTGIATGTSSSGQINVMREVRLPGGGVGHVFNKEIFDRAVKAAEKKSS